MVNRYCLLLLAALLPSSGSIAQSILNVRAEPKGNLVYIHYDLEGALPGQLFEVTVFGSHNHMQTPLTFVRGDVGSNVSPGRKKIEWGAAKELSRFAGEITFRVEARLTFSPFALKSPTGDRTVYRRGRSYPFEWNGGLADEPLQLELYKDTLLNAIITRLPNDGKYSWKIPLETLPGDQYRIRVASVANPTNYKFSNPFTIKRKIPTALKIVPLGIVAGTGILLLPGREPGQPENDDLPGSPGVPNR